MARRRRSQEQIEDLSSALVEVVGADAPMTVRQVFYQLVGRGMVEKTENGYRQHGRAAPLADATRGAHPVELDHRRHAVVAQERAVRERGGGAGDDSAALPAQLLEGARRLRRGVAREGRGT